MYNSVCGTELKERNKTEINAVSNVYIQDDMRISASLLFSSLNDALPPTEWKQIICSVRTWFRRELEAASWPSDRLEIYANSAQVGDPCRQPRRVITTRVVLWQPTDTCGTRVGPKSARFGLTTTCRMQNLHSFSSCWQRKQKTQKGAGHFWQGLAFVCRLGFHLLMCISHPSIHQSIRRSIHAFLH